MTTDTSELDLRPIDRIDLPPVALTSPSSLAVFADDLAPGVMVGEFRIDKKIGMGGMASVYSATHPLIGKRAAIKVMNRSLCVDETAVNRFIQEARAVNQIGHPNIIDVFAFGKLPDGRSYFAMEWLAGETLAETMARGRLSYDDVIAILLQICDALEAVHERGVVHRDIKPENVFLLPVRKRMHVKLLDFGIAKLGGSDGRRRNTLNGTWVGTPVYMSPEQARDKDVDHRSDIYSLGVLAYELVLHRVPFDGDNAMDVVALQMNQAPPAPSSIWPDIPPGLERLLLQMLDKRAERRPSLAEVSERLLVLRDASPVTLDNTSPFRLLDAATPTGGRALQPIPDSLTVLPRRWTPILAVVGTILAVGLAAVAYAAPRLRSRPADAARVERIKAAPIVPATPAPIVAPAATVAAPEIAPPPAAPLAAALQLHIDSGEARVELDGVLVADSVRELRVPVTTQGPHLLVVTAPNHQPLRRAIGFDAGATLDLHVTLKRLVKPTKAHRRERRVNSDYMNPFGR